MKLFSNIYTLILKHCKYFSGTLINSMLEDYNTSETNLNDRVNILHFFSHQFSAHRMENGSKSLFQTTEFKPDAQTVIFIHGFNNLPDEQPIKLIAKNYLKMNVNFLSYNVSAHISKDYFKSVRLVPPLAKILSGFIMELIEEGINSTQLHMIGFSLGAQIASYTGKYLKNNGVKISRITGLDPVSSCFSLNQSNALNKEDATYVDIIHTSLLSFSDVIMGHADFYINGRSGKQPGCHPLDTACNHKRSLKIYSMSILNQFGYPAKQCIGYPHFFKNNCIGKTTEVAGYASSPFCRGVYYVKTNFKLLNALQGIL